MKLLLGVLTVGLAVALIFLFASGVVPGMRWNAEKPVSISFTPRPEYGGVSLYVFPPPPLLEIKGNGTEISVEFTNHLSVPVDVEPIENLSPTCFGVTPKGAAVRRLEPFATQNTFYTVMPLSCEGHQHSLIVDYVWHATTALPKKPGQDLPPDLKLSGHAGFSTSPVEFVGPHQRLAERIVSIIAAVLGAALVPVILAVLTNAYQRGQAARDLVLKDQQTKRDEEQKADALRFEAWKVVFPDIVANTKTHYLPISRRADRIIDTIKRSNPVPNSFEVSTLLERNILLRAQVRRLGLTVGGFYFSSKSGEELVGEFFDLYWPNCLGFLDETAFATLATKAARITGDIPDKLDLSQADDKSDFLKLEQELTNAIGSGRDILGPMQDLLETIQAILNFECDRPLYPKWYEEPPIFDVDRFELKKFPLGTDEPKIRAIMKAYKSRIPRECLAKKP